MKRVLPENWKPRAFILDVDGVMTNGQFAYSAESKAYKIFGPDDHDALLLLNDKLAIQFVTGDRKGFEISKRRIIDDMKFPLELVSTLDRARWIAGRWPLQEVIYMGDGLLDVAVFSAAGYAICPSDGFYLARQQAHYITSHGGGNRAVAEACIHILETFFKPFDLIQAMQSIKSGEWGDKPNID